MVAEALGMLAHATLAFTAVVAVILALRSPLRQWFGAAVAYGAWATLPVVLAVVALPAPRSVVATTANHDARHALGEGIALRWTGNAVLALWAAGGSMTAFVLWRRQRRFTQAMAPLVRGEHGWVARCGRVGPAVIGLLPPRLVLPADFAQRYTADERALILAHERTHLRRGDPYANALAALVRCAFWFHPLLRPAELRFRRDQEVACDAAVLRRFPHSQRRYAAALLKHHDIDPGWPVGCRWQSHPLEERITMLRNPAPSRLRRALGTAFVTVGALGGACATWAAQPAQTMPAESAAVPSHPDGKSTDASAPSELKSLTPPASRTVPFKQTADDAIRGRFSPSYLRDPDAQDDESC